MSILMRIARRVLPSLIKSMMPAKNYDDIFVASFLGNVHLKMLNLRKTYWSFKHGFHPFEYIWYELDRNDYRNYVPARSNYQHRRINGSYNAILANKLLFEKHLKSVTNAIDKLHVVESLGFIENGYLQSLHEDIVTGDFDSLIRLLNKSELILKQISGDGGVGLVLLSMKNASYFLNGQPVELDNLVCFIKQLNNYLIQEKIVQTGFAGEIYPGSVNTMRIGTMIDPVSGKPFMSYAVHRFGSPKSGFVDNVGQGGISASIDMNNGRLSMAHFYTSEGDTETFGRHPVSAVPIYNQQIPDWYGLKNRILEMAGMMPYLKYVGWDFVLSGDELYVLEGNVSPGLGLVQLYQPMKDLPEAWEFFKYYGYVK